MLIGPKFRIVKDFFLETRGKKTIFSSCPFFVLITQLLCSKTVCQPGRVSIYECMFRLYFQFLTALHWRAGELRHCLPVFPFSKRRSCHSGSLTGQYGPALALLLHPALLLAGYGERHFKDKPADVVALLKIRLPVHELLLLQIWSHMCHLYVRILCVQVLGVDLQGGQRDGWINLTDMNRVRGLSRVSPFQSPGSSSRSPVQTSLSKA